MKEETGYQRIQGTKPQTVAYALNDSPAGLAAWIVEKFRTWSDCGGDVERRFTKDQLLTNIMLYWVPQTVNSSCRLYYEAMHAGQFAPRDLRVDVPTGCAIFPGELARPPRRWAERAFNVQRWTRMPSGGHSRRWKSPALSSRTSERSSDRYVDVEPALPIARSPARVSVLRPRIEWLLVFLPTAVVAEWLAPDAHIVIFVAVVGNSAEQSTAILAATRNRMDLALSIAIGSSIQIALFVAPVLVLASYLVGAAPMNLVFTPAEVLAVTFSAVIAGQICGDGESNRLEGLQLLKRST